MDASSGQGLYPLHRCKTIHLVRHAQGFHNVAGEKDHSAYLSPELLDAQLTPIGWQQVDNLRKHVQSIGLSKKVELVICSPLMRCEGILIPIMPHGFCRTMQTAVGIFGGESYKDGIDVPPLMVENGGDSSRPAISSLNCPPFIAVELCREHLGVHWCDKRRSISEYKNVFPAIDFSLIENDDDVLWTPDVRETNEHLAARGKQFLEWLWTRKEKEIVVVTHSGFLIHTLAQYGNDCHPQVKSEICSPFNNCELRSIVIVDRSMMGSDSPTTNYPGKIPSGLDAPSDDGGKKQD
ncbi:OLC1v1017155C1 [Oldenlandia corymbosa var. corymbosa]|uniref:OLC1v1017155C1 n=1 Tax=Oldenlandia corymbosa var. corymbosa TaxID=529605 RepID=A0AAV1E8S2_OLDCO|nr:OLC1v1017155C1 [Oldenlandia corymbosa var. corymbosa]